MGDRVGRGLGAGAIYRPGDTESGVGGRGGGPAGPAVIFSGPGVNFVAPGPKLHEGFVGIGKTFGRSDWLLLGDYQDVSGTRRTSITVNCTVHLRAPAQEIGRASCRERV